MRNRWIPLLAAALCGAVVWLLWPSAKPAEEQGRAHVALAPPQVQKALPGEEADPGSSLAAGLNSAGGTIEDDLLVIDSIFEAFRSNFPGSGNPVGDNSEITGALMGQNSLKLTLIPGGHPAVNDRGELVDRWGTPFFFHQISGDVMEIRSAGPDRRMYTEDDSILTP